MAILRIVLAGAAVYDVSLRMTIAGAAALYGDSFRMVQCSCVRRFVSHGYCRGSLCMAVRFRMVLFSKVWRLGSHEAVLECMAIRFAWFAAIGAVDPVGLDWQRG